MDNHSSHYPDIGHQGEAFVAQWLQQQGWQILEQRWRCRWGELDLVAYNTGVVIGSAISVTTASPSGLRTEPTLAFVEVKTRQRQNWDADGRWAITPKKRSKIIQSTQLYLSTRPVWLDCACRFDVAIVEHGPTLNDPYQSSPGFRMKEYIANAWDLS